ncbi:radical SAM family heme chaperone HemW [Clostridium intestinale]|uniref:Heme chaperone HemW n=1 Tax=Clostridium intestinale DSM 6191 TaxID=1121320 RepID=A0A1M5Y2T3_9CLOT|nr:radical SAM family heme chaperone HemW [Clostridium intestinale]SHI06381.1 oxygen-independent coproporphyrinogen-3 oxidase [Clostridium intestinale DSM 6191]
MKKISLYIHIPFCKQKCKYCDFSSYSGKEDVMSEYVDALNIEINSTSKEYTFKTIFIGGGTPSYLPYEELEKLLKNVSSLNLEEDVEFTVECNPGTLTRDKLELMKKYKVNRLSLGLQSSNESLLKSLGRIHSFTEFKENYDLVRQVGFKNVNVDLMFGLPSQTLKDFEETLSSVVELSPEHISAYSLIVEEGTPFYKLYEKGKLKLPSEEEERAMYEYAVEYLDSKGYKQYEISNFSKDDKECRHNLVYWELGEYLGCGVSAASLLNETRTKNYDKIEDYILSVEKNSNGIEETNHLSKEELMEEFMFLGLRKTSGVSEKDFFERFNVSMESIYKDVINNHIKKGLLNKDNGKIYLNKEGIQLSNYVMSDFLLS